MVDTGLRFIRVQELIHQEWTTIAVDYPGRIYDPNLQHAPFYKIMKTIKRISVIVPLLDEEDNLSLLYQRLSSVLTTLPYAYEIVFVDDGSSDGSLRVLTGLHAEDPDHVRIVEFRRNFGKTAALVAGFQVATGDVLITMDADLQDDPDEIPGMLAELEQGNDLVAAWRVERMDNQQKR
jgi:glycosyltransferase involved in cell wall biosynthesis